MAENTSYGEGSCPFNDAISPSHRRSLLNASAIAEVQSVLILDGMKPEDAWEDAAASVSQIEPFTADQAKLAGGLIAHTRPFGLSLKGPVYAPDRAWTTLKVPCQIHCIR